MKSANPVLTLSKPFAKLFCQPLSNPLFPWTPGTRLETRVNGFLVNYTTISKIALVSTTGLGYNTPNFYPRPFV